MQKYRILKIRLKGMEENKDNAKGNEASSKKLIIHYTDFSDLDRGWSWAIMFASFAVFFILGGYMYGVGIIHMALLKKYGEDVSLTSWAGTLQVALCSLGGPLSTFVVDKFSCRTAVILSGMLFTIGYLGTAFAPNIRVAIFTCGIVAGIGWGICYTANTVVVSMNFKRRRNLAFGFALSGQGLGLFVLSPLMQLALNSYGPVGFFIILASITANVVTFGVMYFPSKLELYTQDMRQFEAKSGQSRTTFIGSIKSYCKVLCIKSIASLCISMFAYGTGLHTLFLYLPTYIESMGFTGLQASFFLSLNGIISVVSRLITGAIANIKYVNEVWLYSGSMFVVSFAMFLYPFIATRLIGQLLFICLIGLSFGVSMTMMAPVGIRFVGINFVSAALGFQLFFCGIGSIIGPVCAGFIIDNGGTYKQCFLTAASSILVAAILSASTIVCSSKSEENEYTVKHDNTEAGELLTVNERETKL